jgi:predicted nuclease with TOPRIM domain
VLPEFRKYTEIVKQLKDKTKERRELLAEKKATPILHVVKHMELSRQIAALTEDMEELRSEKNVLLGLFAKSDNAWMKEIRQWVDSMEASLQRLEEAEGRYNSELDTALEEYKELTKQAGGLDADALITKREAIRPSMTQDAIERLKTAYGKRYDYSQMRLAQQDVVYMLGEDSPGKQQSIRQQLRERAENRQPRQFNPKKHEQER